MPVPSRAGDVIAGKYRVERVLGAGGMGLVVEATHMTLEDRVAIKYLKPEALENSAAVARFAREARAAARIKSEHVCRVLDVLVDDGMPYLVMEYLDGRDLDDLVEKGGAVAVDEGVDYVLQACEALAEAHVAGIVHRDLKPANLFLSKRADGSPVVKVLDFGISKVQPKPGANDAAMTATSSLLGSPLYMSPEQMKATRDVDARTDIWSMGVILYEILTGSRPFVGETIPSICAMILSDPPRPLHGKLPAGVEAVIMKCLEKRPDDRYQSVAELAEALRPFAMARSHLSIDRVVRVIGNRSGDKLAVSAPRPPSASDPNTATGPKALVQPWAQPTVDASAEIAIPLAQPARTGGVAGTHATFESKITERSSRVGRLVLIAGAALAVLGIVGAGITLRLRHTRGTSAASSVVARPDPSELTKPPPPLPPPPPAVPDPPPPAASTTATATASATATATATVAAGAGTGPKPVRTGAPKPPPPPPPRLTIPPPAPPPPPAQKPGFGGRD